jgi:drug/metabolite transporter (DMT)-like permease
MSGPNKHKIDSVATGAAVGALLCWSMSPLFIRYLSTYMDAWSQNLWRYAMATLFLLPFLAIAAARGMIDKRTWKRALAPLVFNVSLQCFWTWCFYYIEPGLGSLLANSNILWVAAFSLIYFAEERGLVRSTRFWSGMLLCIIGLCGVVVMTENFSAKGNLIGIALIFLYSLSWAAYAISARIAFRDIDSRVGFSVVCIYTVAVLAGIAVIFGKPAVIWHLPGWPLWCVVISGMVSISLAHTLYYAAMRRIGTTIPCLVLLANPFIVLAMSFVVFGERLNVWQWLSGILLITGSALAIWAQEHLRMREVKQSSVDC